MDFIIGYFISLLHKIANFLEKILNNAKKNNATVNIDSSSICYARNIRFAKKCIINVEKQSQIIGQLIFEKEGASFCLVQYRKKPHHSMSFLTYQQKSHWTAD